MESSASDTTHDGAGAVSALIRVRLGPKDASYAGGLVAGSKALELFADLETELALKEGGNEGLCAGYESVEFLAPLRVGDFVEARAWIVERGNTSRELQAELHKVLSVDENGFGGVEDPPVLAVRARATIVVGSRVHTAR
jgi:3-aminobutyryl-CoA ammonia-lyase